MPEERTILYVPENNEFMQAAKKAAEELSLDSKHQTGAVVVLNDEIIGRGANGSIYHAQYGCERKRKGIPTGESYELCEGCHPKNHAEPSSIRNTLETGNNPKNADLYLWGHWWCCEDCWNSMIEAKIRDVYLVEGAKERFEK